MQDIFVWNRSKAAANLRKHGISFNEAKAVFKDPNVLFEFDEEHSINEDRFHAIGQSGQQRLLLVVHSEPGDMIRIISARKATFAERQRYESRS